MSSAFEGHLTPVIYPNILTRFANPQNNIIATKIFAGSVIKVNIAKAGSRIIKVKKFDLALFAKLQNLVS